MIFNLHTLRGKLIQILLLIVIVLSCLSYSHYFIDYALLPKIFTLSLGLSVIYFIKLFGKKSNDTKCKYKISSSYILFVAFVIYAAMSITWSTNTQLAYLSVSKLILALLLLRLITTELSQQAFVLYLVYAIALVSLVSNTITLLEIKDLTKITHHSVYGITGAHGHKNLIASFNYLALIITSLALKDAKRYSKLFIVIVMFFQLFVMMTLQCRGVYIALLVYITSFMILYVIKRYHLFSIAKGRCFISTLVFCVFVNILSLYVLPRYIKNTIRDDASNEKIDKIEHSGSIHERLMLWEKSYDLFFQAPWFGVGSNNWQIEYPRNTLPNIRRLRKDNVNFQRPHNDFIWVLCEYGIVGFNIMLIALWIIIYNALVVINKKESLAIRLLLSGFFGYLFIASVSYPLERIEHNVLVLIIVGLLMRYSKVKAKCHGELMIHNLALFLMSFTVFLFVTCVCKSDYAIKKVITKDFHSYQDAIDLCNNVNSKWYTCTPFTIPVSWYKGNTYVLMNEYSKAHKAFDLAKDAHPYHASTLGDYGSALYMVNQKENAIRCYTQAIMINPGYTDALYNLINVLLELERYDEAQHFLYLVEDSNYLGAFKGFIDANKSITTQ